MNASRVVGGLLVAGQVVGWLLLAAALALLGVEAIESLEAGAYQGLALGEVWYRLDAGSLNITQAVIQRYLHPALWDPVLITILQWPGWITAGAPGGALVALCRRRQGVRSWFARRR